MFDACTQLVAVVITDTASPWEGRGAEVGVTQRNLPFNAIRLIRDVSHYVLPVMVSLSFSSSIQAFQGRKM